MTDLKNLIKENLLSDYSEWEVNEMLAKATVRFEGIITVTYDNGKSDRFKIVNKEHLVLLDK